LSHQVDCDSSEVDEALADFTRDLSVELDEVRLAMLGRLDLERLRLELTIRQIGHEGSVKHRVICLVHSQVDVPVLVEVLVAQRLCVCDRELELSVVGETRGRCHSESEFVGGAESLVLRATLA